MLQGDPHSHILDVSVSEDVGVRLCVSAGDIFLICLVRGVDNQTNHR